MNSTKFAVSDFRQATKTHRLWKHPFLARCRAGSVTLSEVRVLAGQMYKFSKEFGRILAGIMVDCPDEAARVVIAENLYEELGEGDLMRTHAELFRRFTRALEITDEELEQTPMEAGTKRLVETYLSLPSRHGWLGALGAVCFASEGIVSALYTQLQNGIAGATALPKESMIFFELHVVADTGHAAALSNVIAPRVTTPEAFAEIALAVREAMDSRVAFFDGVMRRAHTNGVAFDTFVRTQDLLRSQDLRSQDLGVQ